MNARLANLEAAILAPGGIARLLAAPRHGLTTADWARLASACRCLDRCLGHRVFLEQEIVNLLVQSLTHQGVLPPNITQSTDHQLAGGFDPTAPQTYEAIPNHLLLHLFCGDAVVALLFNPNDETGYVPEAFCVHGRLSEMDANFDPEKGAPRLGRVWAYGSPAATSAWIV